MNKQNKKKKKRSKLPDKGVHLNKEKSINTAHNIDNPRIVGDNLEGKLNKMAYQRALTEKPGALGNFARADWWATKVRTPLANKLAGALISSPPSKFKGTKNAKQHVSLLTGVKDLFHVLVQVILLMVVIATLTTYTLPEVLGVRLIKDIDFVAGLLLLVAIAFIWEEEVRFYRATTLQMDKLSHNWLDFRLTDTKEHPTHISRVERYRIGWLAGKWSWTDKKWYTKILPIGVFTLLQYLLMNLGSFIDTATGTGNHSVNVQELTNVASKAPLLIIITSVFLAPWVEEFVFRGIIWRVFAGLTNQDKAQLPQEEFGWQTDLSKFPEPLQHATKARHTFGLIFGAIIQAGLFAWAHSPASWGYALGLFGAGLILAYVYWGTGDIKYPIYVHTLSNAMAIMVPMLIQLFV